MKYKRILLKLSGEALMGNKKFGIDNERLMQYAKEIKEISALCEKRKIKYCPLSFLQLFFC